MKNLPTGRIRKGNNEQEDTKVNPDSYSGIHITASSQAQCIIVVEKFQKRRE